MYLFFFSGIKCIYLNCSNADIVIALGFLVKILEFLLMNFAGNRISFFESMDPAK